MFDHFGNSIRLQNDVHWIRSWARSRVGLQRLRRCCCGHHFLSGAARRIKGDRRRRAGSDKRRRVVGEGHLDLAPLHTVWQRKPLGKA
jgi:hypothetical protein